MSGVVPWIRESTEQRTGFDMRMCIQAGRSYGAQGRDHWVVHIHGPEEDQMKKNQQKSTKARSIPPQDSVNPIILLTSTNSSWFSSRPSASSVSPSPRRSRMPVLTFFWSSNQPQLVSLNGSPAAAFGCNSRS